MLDELHSLTGSWSGTNRLWLMPGDPVRESSSLATLEPVAQGRGLLVRYSWAFEGAPQDGMLLLMPAGEEDAAALAGVLVDSWHVGDGYMPCRGAWQDGRAAVTGQYGPPEAPWHWRTAVEPRGEAGWRLTMHNILPDGTEALAVEVDYRRS